MKMWFGNLGDYEIPADIDSATRWRKDGQIDRRFKNAAFWAWLKSIGPFA